MATSSDANRDRQYLKAMNIGLWVAKDHEQTAVSMPEPVAAAPDAPVKSVAAIDKSLSDLTAAELAATAANRTILSAGPLQPAELMVVTEDVSLSDECTHLLASMFKAIAIDSSHWLHCSAIRAKGAEPLSEVEKSVNPKAIVFMLRTNGQANALPQLRGMQHKAQALQSLLAVTFHPQDLLDNPDLKRPAWEDLKQLRQWLPQG